MNCNILKFLLLLKKFEMDVLKQVEQLIKSGDVANLELWERKKKASLGDIKPVTFDEYIGLVKDSAADFLLPESIRSQMSVGAKEAVYPARYIYKYDLRLCTEFASSLIQGNDCYNAESGVGMTIICSFCRDVKIATCIFLETIVVIQNFHMILCRL